MSQDTFDLIVIGAGPGGYPAAIRGAQLGLKTACIEKEKVGGVCLNWGCIPTKALLKTAELAHKIRHADAFGLTVGALEIDYAKVVQRSRSVSERFERGVRGLFKKYNVTQVAGTARLAGDGKVEVTAADGSTTTLTAKHIVVATGARAKTFPGIEPDGERVVTYREAIVSMTRPERVTVLGAGAIGIEFAYFWNAMGSEVTVVEGQDQILPIEDHEISAAVKKSLEASGIRFHTGQKVRSVERNGDETVTTLEDGTALVSDQTLAALGITPNTENLGLEEMGVSLNRGFIAIDADCRTNVPGVFAVGDVTTRGGLAHTATAQAHICVERIAGKSVPDLDYTSIPGCTYCQPQVASVGMTEREAKASGQAYRIGRFPFMANGKAAGAGNDEGFVKVIIDERYGEILGAHIVGSEATEMIAEFVLARSSEATAEVLMHTVHAHPTHAEAMLEAVAQAYGVSVHI